MSNDFCSMRALQQCMEEKSAIVEGLEEGGLQFELVNDMGETVTGTVETITKLEKAINNAYRKRQVIERNRDFPHRKIEYLFEVKES